MNAPDKVTELKAGLAVVIFCLTELWGYTGWAVLLLLAVIVLDYITGSWAAKLRGEWTSAIARQGLWHKLGEIVALMVAALCDLGIKVLLHTEAAPLVNGFSWGSYVTLIVCAWYMITEIGSILENLKKLGVPIPAWMTKGIEAAKEKADKPPDIPGKN